MSKFSNLLLAAEARELWCPYGRVLWNPCNKPISNDMPPVFNRIEDDGAESEEENTSWVSQCIADRCALWRWHGISGRGYCGAGSAPSDLS